MKLSTVSTILICLLASISLGGAITNNFWDGFFAALGILCIIFIFLSEFVALRATINKKDTK